MISDKSSTDENKICDERSNKLTEKTEAEIAKIAGVNVKDLDNAQLLTDALKEDFSVVYDKSLEEFYRVFSESKFSKIDENLVETEATKFGKKIVVDFKVKRLMDSSYPHKVAFVDSFISGLHDALMSICMEENE
jgi:uncharacterized protein YicC (UPF0701 family)